MLALFRAFFTNNILPTSYTTGVNSEWKQIKQFPKPLGRPREGEKCLPCSSFAFGLSSESSTFVKINIASQYCCFAVVSFAYFATLLLRLWNALAFHSRISLRQWVEFTVRICLPKTKRHAQQQKQKLSIAKQQTHVCVICGKATKQVSTMR